MWIYDFCLTYMMVNELFQFSIVSESFFTISLSLYGKKDLLIAIVIVF